MGKCDEECCGSLADLSDEKYGKAAAASTKENLKLLQLALVVGVVTLTIVLFQGKSGDSHLVHQASKFSAPANIWDVSPAKKEDKEKKDKTDDKEKKKTKKKEARKKVDVKILEAALMKLDTEVRSIKKSLPNGHFMETDPGALEVTKKLQDATQKLMAARYGPDYDDPAGDVYGGHHYRIKFDLAFQKSMPDYAENGASGSFTIEMAPTSIIPHAVFTFLEVARLFKRNAASGGFGTAFHRNADHVLQARVQVRAVQHLAFQEYDKRYPHKKYTLGYAGRPSGPEFYVSIQNNSGNHGPGSQQKANPNEADGNFGRVISGFDVVDRVHKMPGHGFIGTGEDVVGIQEMTIQVPSADGTYTVWKGA